MRVFTRPELSILNHSLTTVNKYKIYWKDFVQGDFVLGGFCPRGDFVQEYFVRGDFVLIPAPEWLSEKILDF